MWERKPLRGWRRVECHPNIFQCLIDGRSMASRVSRGKVDIVKSEINSPGTVVFEPRPTSQPCRLSIMQWVVLTVACIGFAFDTYEIVILPLVVRPALIELGNQRAGTPEFNRWVGLLFYIPLAAGGIFGLAGGYLADRFGRRGVLVWSILLYGISAFAAGYSESPLMLLVFRCGAMIGACVEFVAGVAWIAELFPNPRQRESMLGYTQVFSALGSVLVAAAYYIAVTYGNRLPEIRGGHQGWRYALIFGMLPAIPLIIIRPFLPESPMWQEKKARGMLSRPRLSELFQPALRKPTVVATLMTACSFAAAFGAHLHVARIVPGLPQVRNLPSQLQEQTVSVVELYSDMGNLAGRLLFAFLVVRILGQRRLLRSFLAPGLVIFPLVFLFPARFNLEWFEMGIVLAVAAMTGQFSFWGNYLPRIYPTHLRGTGESFATNIGGRLIGASAALATTQLANVMPGGNPSAQLAYAAAGVSLFVYSVGLIASFWLPEPEQKALPE
jgi:MFS family permease